MPKQITMPQIGEEIDSAVVLSVLVSAGDAIDAGDPLLELESDKATTEVPAPEPGVVEKVLVSEGQEIHSGDAILMLEARQEEEPAEEEPAEEEPAEEERPSRARPPTSGAPARRSRAPTHIPGAVSASPRIRRLARELGVVIDDVVGTGSEDRITEDDVKSHVRHLLERNRQLARRDAPPELPDFSMFGEVERVPMSPLRRTIAERVEASWRRIPSVSQFDRADITEIEAFRRAVRAQDDPRKVSLTAIFVKVAAVALERFVDFNASVDIIGAALIRKRYVHIGVAVDTEAGLLVPVIRDAHTKDITEIDAELRDLAEASRNRTVSPEQLHGASFSITNLGAHGTTDFTPIIPWPQVAILGVGRAEPKPVFDGKAFVPRTIVPLGITYDHRAADGADAARFLGHIVECLEQPLRLLLSP